MKKWYEIISNEGIKYNVNIKITDENKLKFKAINAKKEDLIFSSKYSFEELIMKDKIFNVFNDIEDIKNEIETLLTNEKVKISTDSSNFIFMILQIKINGSFFSIKIKLDSKTDRRVDKISDLCKIIKNNLTQIDSIEEENKIIEYQLDLAKNKVNNLLEKK